MYPENGVKVAGGGVNVIRGWCQNINTLHIYLWNLKFVSLTSVLDIETNTRERERERAEAALLSA
jgi:hypothetical protein